MTRLAGKVVLVSGATTGIGKVSAEVFAREGARVVLTGQRAEGEAVAARPAGRWNRNPVQTD